MLSVMDIETFYGRSQILFGVSLEVGAGEVIAVMGRNGMGKTTLIRSIVGLTPPKSGSIRFEGKELSNQPSYVAARAGISLVPEGRQIFPTLTVRENLIATAANRSDSKDSWTIEKVFDLFPKLAERTNQSGITLSGGEQQMLAIGRALMTNGKLLILDDATEGLAPIVCEEIWCCLEQIKASGQAIMIVDRNLEKLLGIADRHYFMEKGRIAWSGTSAECAENPELKHCYLGV
ncbi:MAG: ABC transporter ATP-binding protein [Deltaproteobacteria bacterium]|jgi:branched-chain amino acid transport system ATP-binding protein|nr:ABC transporter ATP-binding protein [Deltaproteobacteria bacterium]